MRVIDVSDCSNVSWDYLIIDIIRLLIQLLYKLQSYNNKSEDERTTHALTSQVPT